MSDGRDEMRAAAMFEAECATTKSDAQKDTVIKALADALWESGEQDPEGSWHSSGCDHWTSNGERCGEHCQQRRAALRLAGRL